MSDPNLRDKTAERAEPTADTDGAEDEEAETDPLRTVLSVFAAAA